MLQKFENCWAVVDTCLVNQVTYDLLQSTFPCPKSRFQTTRWKSWKNDPWTLCENGDANGIFCLSVYLCFVPSWQRELSSTQQSTAVKAQSLEEPGCIGVYTDPHGTETPQLRKLGKRLLVARLTDEDVLPSLG